jgi:hypothetical protein
MTFLRYPNNFAQSGPATDYIKIQFIRRDYTSSQVTYKKDGFNDIILNMPQKITENLSQNFANSGLGELGILDAFGNRQAMEGGPFANIAKRLVENFALNKTVEIAGRLGASQLSENGVLSGVSGIVFNPNLEVLYEGPTFRKFNFQFAMFTKSKEDAMAIKGIVDTFRQASLPRTSGDVNDTKLAEAFASAAGAKTITGTANAVANGLTGNLGNVVSQGLNDVVSAAGLLAAGAGTASASNPGGFFGGDNRFIKQPPFIYLQYMRGVNRHPFIPSLLPASLDAVNFDYTPTGNYTTLSDLEDIKGATTVGVTITLQLTEVTNLFGDQLEGTAGNPQKYQPKKPTIV